MEEVVQSFGWVINLTSRALIVGRVQAYISTTTVSEGSKELILIQVPHRLGYILIKLQNHLKTGQMIKQPKTFLSEKN
jgi:hypothetical protein